VNSSITREPTRVGFFPAGWNLRADGVLLHEIATSPGIEIKAPRWERARRGPAQNTFVLDGTEPSIGLETASLVARADGDSTHLCAPSRSTPREGPSDSGRDVWLASGCAGHGVDPDTVTPAGGGRNDPAALAQCVGRVIRIGGGGRSDDGRWA